MKLAVVRRSIAGSFALAALATIVAAGPVAAGGVTLSYAKSLPVAPVISGNVGVTYGGGYNSFWLTTAYSDTFRLVAPEGVGSTGLNSPNFTYSGTTGGKITARIRGSFAWSWQCSAIMMGFARGGANLVVQLYDATAKRVAAAKTLTTVNMAPCAAVYPYTRASTQTTAGTTPSDYSPAFSGSTIVKGHVYRILVGMGASVAGSNVATSAALTVKGKFLSVVATW